MAIKKDYKGKQKRIQQTNEIRVKEFLECLGNGKTIYQIENEELLT